MSGHNPIHHHPDETLLLDHAAGKLDPAMALVIATHLSFCAPCAGAVALAGRVGGILLSDFAPTSLMPGALEKTLAHLGPQDARAVAGNDSTNDNTPAPLRAFLGCDQGQVRWRAMGPRLGYVNLYQRGPVALRLLRGAPGANTGSHSHRGMEYTLVLQGGFTDVTGIYGPGDFQVASAAVNHDPVADAGEDCINLALTTGPLRFDGLVPRLAGRLFGF